MNDFNKDVSQLNRNELLQILHDAQDCITYLENMQENLESDSRIKNKQIEKEKVKKDTEELKEKIAKTQNRIEHPAQFNFKTVLILGGILFIISNFLGIDLVFATIMAISGGMALELIILACTKDAEILEKELKVLEKDVYKLDAKVSEIDEDIYMLEKEQEEILIRAREYCDSKNLDDLRKMIPERYFSIEDTSFLCQVLECRRADSWKEAINLYEDYLYKTALEERQEKQIDISKQAVETQQESLSELKKHTDLAQKQNDLVQRQNQLAQKQLAVSKRTSQYTRQTRNADRVNALINLIKK